MSSRLSRLGDDLFVFIVLCWPVSISPRLSRVGDDLFVAVALCWPVSISPRLSRVGDRSVCCCCLVLASFSLSKGMSGSVIISVPASPTIFKAKAGSVMICLLL